MYVHILSLSVFLAIHLRLPRNNPHMIIEPTRTVELAHSGYGWTVVIELKHPLVGSKTTPPQLVVNHSRIMASQTSMKNIPPPADGDDVANVVASPARTGANNLPTITQSCESPPATPAPSNPPQAGAFELASSEKKKNVNEPAILHEETRVESGNGNSSSPGQLSQPTVDFHSQLMVMFNATTEDETPPNVEVSKEEKNDTSNMNDPTNSEGHSMSTNGSKSNEQKDESQSNYFPSQSKYNTRGSSKDPKNNKKNKKHSLGGDDSGGDGGDSDGDDDDDDDDDDASSEKSDDYNDEEFESDEEGVEEGNDDEVKFLGETTCIYTK